MPLIDLNNTFGAFLICVFVSALLFGMTCVQVFYYFQNYASDGILIKGTVFTLLILESLHSAFNMHAIYNYAIVDYLNPSALLVDLWSATMTLGTSSGIVLLVHMFYLKRIYHLSRKNIPLVALLTILCLAQFGASIAVTVEAFELKIWTMFGSTKNTIISDTALALAVATDILIAASLLFYLHTSRSGVKRTNTLINKLMTYAINNWLLTTVFDIMVLIFLTTEDGNLIFFSVFQILGNLYTNSMMATLNSRRSLALPNHAIHNEPSAAMSTFRVQGPVMTALVESLQVNRGSQDFTQIPSTKGVGIV